MDGDTFSAADLNPTAAAPAETTTDSTTGAAPVTPAAKAAPAEPTGETPADENDEQNPGDDPAADRKKNPVQKRIDEITRDKYEAQREADYWRGVAEGRIKTAPAEEAKPQQVEQVNLPGLPPKPVFNETYNGDYDAYVEDLAAWRFQKERVTADLKDSQRREEDTARQAFNGHLERVEKTRAAVADFDEVLDATPIRVRNDLAKEIVLSDQSAEIMYYLAKNPGEAERLNALPANQQIREIGRLEERLTRKETTTPAIEPKRVSQAPAPVTPVGTSREAAAKSPDDMSMEEWAKYEQARVQKRQHR